MHSGCHSAIYFYIGPAWIAAKSRPNNMRSMFIAWSLLVGQHVFQP